jgi:hypothetical protein
MKRAIVIFLISSGLVACLVLGAALVESLFAPSSDRQLIDELFRPDLPGYARIDILDQAGKSTPKDPRRLELEVVMDSGPIAVACRGRLTYFQGDPGSLGIQWYNLECVGQRLLIQRARQALNLDDGALPCQAGKIAAVIEHWIKQGQLQLTNIRLSELRTLVSDVLQPANSTPDTGATSAALFDVSKLSIHDLAPDLPDNTKVKAYVLRCDGALEAYLLRSAAQLTSAVALGKGDVVLDTPLELPATLP